MFDRVKAGDVELDQLHARMPEEAARGGGEIAETCPDREHHIGLGRHRIGGAAPGDANGAGGCGMIPGKRSLAGLGLGNRHAVPVGEAGKRIAGEGIMDAAAGNDQRRLSAAQCRGHRGELRRVGLRPADPPAARREKAFGIIEGFGLHILRQSERHRSALGRVGQDSHRLRQAGEDLLRPGDAVPPAGHRAEAVIG